MNTELWPQDLSHISTSEFQDFTYAVFGQWTQVTVTDSVQLDVPPTSSAHQMQSFLDIYFITQTDFVFLLNVRSSESVLCFLIFLSLCQLSLFTTYFPSFFSNIVVLKTCYLVLPFTR